MKIEESYSESNLTRSECFVAKILKLQQNMEFPNTLLGTGGAAPRGSSPLPGTSKYSNTKTTPMFGVVLCSIHSSDARRTLLAQSTSKEERAIEIQPGSRREFGISRMPRHMSGNAQLNHQTLATRNGTMKRNFCFNFISRLLSSTNPQISRLECWIERRSLTKALLQSLARFFPSVERTRSNLESSRRQS